MARDLAGLVGTRVRLCGWAAGVDARGEAPALALRDPTGVARLVAAGEDVDGALRLVRRESAVEALGTVQPYGDDVEVAVDDLRVPGPAVDEPPAVEGAPLDTRLDWRFVDLRHPRNQLIFRVQTTAERAMRSFWHELGFVELHSPKLRPTPNKSGAELFRVDYFGRAAYLAQSPQFYKQMAMAAGFDRIFEIGPVFRANPTVSGRHDTEFTSIDVEMSWIDSHDDLMTFESELLRHVLAQVRETHEADIAGVFGTEIEVPPTPFPRMALADARAVVEATGWVIDEDADDLDAEGMRRLAAHVKAEHGHEFVFVTDYPEPTRPFYHMRRAEGSVETRSFDLLWRGVEITTGAQREHRPERLAAQASARGIALESIRSYLDFFRFGCPPHGGFGLGLTRLLMGLLRLDNVREVTYLYRGPDRITP